jgi:hypothetical protein
LYEKLPFKSELKRQQNGLVRRWIVAGRIANNFYGLWVSIPLLAIKNRTILMDLGFPSRFSPFAIILTKI